MESNETKEILEKINLIFKKIDEITQEKKSSYESEQINEIATALSKAQGEYPTIPYNRISPHYQKEYTDSDLIMSKIRPILTKYNLSLIQRTEINNDATILHTKVLHSSGQWIETRARLIPTKNDDLTTASALNLAKRLQAMSLLNITIAGDIEDDEAEEQMKVYRDDLNKGTDPIKYTPKGTLYVTIDSTELEQLEEEFKNYPDLAENVLKAYKIQTLRDLPKDKFKYVMAQAIKNKNARNGI